VLQIVLSSGPLLLFALAAPAAITSPAGPVWSVRPAHQPDSAPVTRLVPISPQPLPARLLPAAAPMPAPVAGDPELQAPLAAAPTLRPYRLRPSLGGGQPSGYVGGWGDYFIAGTAGTRGSTNQKLRDYLDGSVNAGFAIGDPVRAIGVEVFWGAGSIKDFNANGGFGFSAGRLLLNRWNLQVAAAGGLIDAYQYGNEPGRRFSSPYGALTVAMPLRPRDPVFQQVLQISVGGGGKGLAQVDQVDNEFQISDGGFFAAAGVEVLPNLGVSAGVSSRSTVVNVSYIPFRDLPIFVNMAAADVFGDTPYGISGLLTVGWSDNWRTGYFHFLP
jgi:hypothetical protein